MNNITQAEENAVIMAARGAIGEFKKLPRKDKKLDAVRKDKKLDAVRKEIIDKWYSKLHGVIRRQHFIHYIADQSGVLDKLRGED